MAFWLLFCLVILGENGSIHLYSRQQIISILSIPFIDKVVHPWQRQSMLNTVLCDTCQTQSISMTYKHSIHRKSI